MHKPLTAGVPWNFPIPGVCAEAAENTDGQCVAHQLSKHIRIRGAGAPFSKEQLTEELMNASLELYEDSDEELLDCPGFTAAAIRKVCESYGIPFHAWVDARLQMIISIYKHS